MKGSIGSGHALCAWWRIACVGVHLDCAGCSTMTHFAGTSCVLISCFKSVSYSAKLITVLGRYQAAWLIATTTAAQSNFHLRRLPHDSSAVGACLPFNCGGRKAAALLLLPCVTELAVPLRAAFCAPGGACCLAMALPGALRLTVGGSPALMLQHCASCNVLIMMPIYAGTL